MPLQIGDLIDVQSVGLFADGIVGESDEIVRIIGPGVFNEISLANRAVLDYTGRDEFL